MSFKEMSTDCQIFVLMQQCMDEGVGLCTRHILHRTDHMKNGKQHTVSAKIQQSVDISLKLKVTSTFWKKTNSQF